MKQSYLVILTAGALCFAFQAAQASVLFQDGFNYPTGVLGGNGGWEGSASAVFSVQNGNLTYPGLNDLGGNELAVMLSGSSTSITNGFSGGNVTSGDVYFSFLIQSTSVPTSASYLLSLNPAGTKPNGGTDALAVYTEPNGTGTWSLGVRSDNAAAAVYDSADVLSANTTYFVVVEYAFGSPNATASLFLNPVPGGSQPGSPSATVNGTVTPLNIGDVGIKGQGTMTDGNFILDNFIIGTTWADVTPTGVPEPSSLVFAALGLLGGFMLRFRRR